MLLLLLHYKQTTFSGPFPIWSFGVERQSVELSLFYAESHRNTKKLKYCSRSFKLDGFCWCTANFKSYHRFSIGLRSGLWLGHFNTFKCLTSFPVPAVEKHPHSMTLPPPCFTVGMLLFSGDERCWVCTRHSVSLMSKKLHFCLIWPVSQTCLLANTKCVCLFLSLSNGFISGHSSIKPSSVECMGQSGPMVSRPELRDPFYVSILGWSGREFGWAFYVLCFYVLCFYFYVLAGHGSQSGTAVYRCLWLGTILRYPFPYCVGGKLTLFDGT